MWRRRWSTTGQQYSLAGRDFVAYIVDGMDLASPIEVTMGERAATK